MSTPFDDAALHAALENYFHYPAFRPGQIDALRHVLNKRDTLVVMPTGSGKSLIYQIAALVQEGTALVISPLVALMKDQTDSLTRRGISATFINSTLTVAEQDKRLDALTRNQYKIVLVAPERLRSGNFRGALKRANAPPRDSRLFWLRATRRRRCVAIIDNNDVARTEYARFEFLVL